jgi:hypothetical protein
MLSSLNVFGGLSAANLLTLLGANSSNTSSNAAAAGASRSASASVSTSSANDPAQAIKAILAQAQIEQAQAAPSAAGSTSLVTAAAAYSAQTGGSSFQTADSAAILSAAGAVTSISADASYSVQSGGSSAATGEGVTISPEVVRVDQAQTETSAGGPTISAASETVQMPGISSLTSASAISTPPASGVDVTSGSNADNFQLALSVGGESIAISFNVEGLGLVQPVLGGSDYSVGQGPLADFFQMDISSGGQSASVAFNIDGLDATQAQQVAAAFEQTTSAPSSIGTAVNTGGRYDENYAPGVSVIFQEITGYQ